MTANLQAFGYYSWSNHFAYVGSSSSTDAIMSPSTPILISSTLVTIISPNASAIVGCPSAPATSVSPSSLVAIASLGASTVVMSPSMAQGIPVTPETIRVLVALEEHETIPKGVIQLLLPVRYPF